MIRKNWNNSFLNLLIEYVQLSLVYSLNFLLIETHGGKIWGGNNVDHGAAFSFSLPADGNRTLSLTVFGIIILGLVPTVDVKAIAGNIDSSYVVPQPDQDCSCCGKLKPLVQ
jgi:hypothetical protein